MTEIVNLRMERKRAKRRSDDKHAQTQRAVHGMPKRLRVLDDANRQREERALNGHKIETGDRP